ncbi:MAG: hypothetical protein CVV64_11295 [Candidatus Wallbacteria bacterium HGW-Wallbacteria-1]|jgi:hypothetical protein|uniref:Gingipain R n=1 Tax=Candidatus Wallbacteria bacterium HGW-Wallbacteria-1 TaxID=2013854 RepID=A0A2N1PP23_9BACT|nr:MAG: hypothetical protein CVV64_11295 [Candidatus Wallbacteria bacterium HGW-Wallbacteria-1]
MRKERLFALLLLAPLALFLATGMAEARWIQFSDLDSRAAAPTGIELTSDTVTSRVAPALTFQVHVEGVEANTVETSMGRFTRMVIPGYQASETVGAPAIPVMNQLVEIPYGARLDAQVLESSSNEYSLADLDVDTRLMPRQAPQPKDGTEVPFAFDLAAYVNEGWQAEEMVSITEVGFLRDRRLALITFRPMAYNPSERRVRVATDMTVKITLDGSDTQATLNGARVYGSPYFTNLGAKVLVPSSLGNLRATLPANNVAYLIIADRMFEAELAEFIAWKKEKGLIVKVAYTDEIGKTTDAIKGYIHNLYNNPTSDFPAPTFVLFVGDNDQIPAFRGTTGSHITDLYYVAVTDDYISDIYTGRFSARNVDELRPQIAKTLEYEQFKFADPSFLNDVVMVAGWDSRFTVSHGYPQIKYGLKYYFNKDQGFKKISTYLSAGSSQNESSIRAAVSAGAAYVNYTAHGSSTSWADPSFSISQINALQNKGKYPLVVGNCCLTNKFEVGLCFGEAWLRAADKGAIGYIGGTNSTYWDEDLWWGNGYYPLPSSNPNGDAPLREKTGLGAYDSVFDNDAFTNATMMISGNLAVEASNSPRKKYYWEVYQLMGDPSLAIYLPKAGVNKVSRPKTIESRTQVLDIRAKADSMVALSVNGDLVASTMANEAGLARLDLNNLSRVVDSVRTASPDKAAKARLTITASGVQPHRSFINIVD